MNLISEVRVTQQDTRSKVTQEPIDEEIVFINNRATGAPSAVIHPHSVSAYCNINTTHALHPSKACTLTCLPLDSVEVMLSKASHMDTAFASDLKRIIPKPSSAENNRPPPFLQHQREGPSTHETHRPQSLRQRHRTCNARTLKDIRRGYAHRAGCT